jgi:two-component system sensor histidine kinase YcbA
MKGDMGTDTSGKYDRIKSAIYSSILIFGAYHINISLFGGDLLITASVVVFTVLIFLFPGSPILLASSFASLWVFLFHASARMFFEGTLARAWSDYSPEILFFASYGIMAECYFSRRPLAPFRFSSFIPLFVIEFAANFLEAFARFGSGVFASGVPAWLSGASAVRTCVSLLLLWALDSYGVLVLVRDDAKRYQSLLVITSSLKGELTWLEKSASTIERTMHAAYGLYTALDDIGHEKAGTALEIARDIHEIKKEYMLIRDGISGALDAEAVRDGMRFGEILDVLARSMARAAASAGKQVKFELSCGDDFYTHRHYQLLSILRNLLCNALEAAGSEPVTVVLLQRVCGEDCIIVVSDDCGGIPPEYEDKIFVPRFTTKINYETGEIQRGLGLSLVKALVENELSGKVRAESGGGGTSFVVTVPLAGLTEAV